MKTLAELARLIQLDADDVIPYGSEGGKISLAALDRPGRAGQLILVTAMSPNPAGEGKTTVAIGLADALVRLGESAVVALREPSMGPVFGKKGGGSGGGRAQLRGSAAINLHFHGDLAAITQAHNLLASALDNHLHFGNALGLDVRKVSWPRVLDLNERSLRQVVVGLGGLARESAFVITAASEVMAILALSRDWGDLRRRLGAIEVATTREGQPVSADDLKVAGAMAILLRDALQPNLVQTLDGTPAIVHCGPFANIAHGTSSLVGSLAGLRGADFVVQEAGFGADLGGEKFLDLFCPQLGQDPALAVVVVTLPGIAHHGLENALDQLGRMQRFGVPVVACLNARADDDREQQQRVLQELKQAGQAAFLVDVYAQGGEGALDLADFVRGYREPAPVKRAYLAEQPLAEKIERVALGVYGAERVDYSPKARQQLLELERRGINPAYVCWAKTQYSFSDDPKKTGLAKNFRLNVRELQWRAGAGFVVPLAGEMMNMPALPSAPNYEAMDLLPDGTIVGMN